MDDPWQVFFGPPPRAQPLAILKCAATFQYITIDQTGVLMRIITTHRHPDVVSEDEEGDMVMSWIKFEG